MYKSVLNKINSVPSEMISLSNQIRLGVIDLWNIKFIVAIIMLVAIHLT